MDGKYVYAAWKAALENRDYPVGEFFPTGLGGVEGHPQPGIYKVREGGGYMDGKKQDHTFVPVKIYLVDADGAVVHYWRAGLTLKALQGKDKDVDPHRVWLWCQRKLPNGINTLNAVSQDEYRYWMEHGRWLGDAPDHSQPEPAVEQVSVPADGAAPAGVGHNSEGDPDGYEALKALIEQHAGGVRDWLASNPEGETAGNKAANWLGDIRKIKSRFEARYKQEHEPIDRLEAEFRRTWGSLAKSLEGLRQQLSGAVAAIGDKERQRRQAIADAEAAKRAAELRAKAEAERAEQLRAHEAEVARIKAEAEAKSAQEPSLFDEPPAAIELPPPPPPVAEPVVVAEQVKVAFGGSTGRKVSVRAVKAAVIEDWAAAAAHYAGSDRVRAVVQALANADAKNGIEHPFMKTSKSATAA